MIEFNHKSVLFSESIEALNIKKGGVYIDGTAGGAGHSAQIARSLEGTGLLISIDRDPDAITVIKQRLKDYSNVKIVCNNFSNIDTVLDDLSLGGFDGLLLDIGVSSFQLDTPQRGFSYHSDAPLDMRMSKTGPTAADIVNTYSEKELADIIYKYSGEKFSRSIARNIVSQREISPIKTTGELVEIIKKSMPMSAKRDGHPARKTFQALRIEVNGELTALETALDKAIERANKGARICVITFHSLEDRIVKLKFRQWAQGCTCPPEFPVCVCGKTPRVKLLKPILPKQEEIEDNNRSRSAKLRVACKL